MRTVRLLRNEGGRRRLPRRLPVHDDHPRSQGWRGRWAAHGRRRQPGIAPDGLPRPLDHDGRRRHRPGVHLRWPAARVEGRHAGGAQTAQTGGEGEVDRGSRGGGLEDSAQTRRAGGRVPTGDGGRDSSDVRYAGNRVDRGADGGGGCRGRQVRPRRIGWSRQPGLGHTALRRTGDGAQPALTRLAQVRPTGARRADLSPGTAGGARVDPRAAGRSGHHDRHRLPSRRQGNRAEDRPETHPRARHHRGGVPSEGQGGP